MAVHRSHGWLVFLIQESAHPRYHLEVQEVAFGGPAYRSGLRNGDLVLLVDGQPVNSLEELTALHPKWTPGQEVSIEVLRNIPSERCTSQLSCSVAVGTWRIPVSQNITEASTLEDYSPPAVPSLPAFDPSSSYDFPSASTNQVAVTKSSFAAQPNPIQEKPWMGMTLRKDKRHKLLFIDTVTPGGPAYIAGLEVGDIVHTINGKTIDTMAKLGDQAATWKVGDSLKVVVKRDGALQLFSLLLTKRSAWSPSDSSTAAYSMNIPSPPKRQLDGHAMEEYAADLFTALDLDQDGEGRREDLSCIGPWLEETHGKTLPLQQLQAIFDKHDRTRSGFVVRSEFLGIARDIYNAIRS